MIETIAEDEDPGITTIKKFSLFIHFISTIELGFISIALVSTEFTDMIKKSIIV